MAGESEALQSGVAAGAATGNPYIGGAIAIGSYLSARENRKAQEREAAIQAALQQRQQELNAIQNTGREMDTAYGNIMQASSQSLRY